MERRPEQSRDSLLWNVKRKKMERTIHYIWINWISYTGSKSSRLKGGNNMKKAFKIFSIMFVIEIVLIAILDAMA